MHYVWAIGSRYGALAIQFLVVLLVTNALPQDQAGQYFVAFGLVATLFCLTGLGLPDGLVVTLGKAIAEGQTETVRNALRRSVLRGVLSALALFGGGAAVAILAGQDPEYALLTAAWTLLYGIVFVAAQGLVAIRSAALGSFFFYSSTNLFLLLTSVPYLLFAPAPTLIGLMWLTLLAASLSAVAALGVLWRKARVFTGAERATLGPAARTGGVIALSRMLQGMIYWIPVWLTTALYSAADAAVIATAGRLLIAVSAGIAALRFSVRPSIVAAAAQDDWPAIERLGRRISLATTLFTLAAMAGLWLFGQPLLDLLFGPSYAAAWGILLILLVGALGEAFGGPVDEVLKMTGRSALVLGGLVVTVLIETLLGLAFAGVSAQAIAWSQALAFAGMYGYQVLMLWRLRGILIMPLRPRGRQSGQEK